MNTENWIVQTLSGDEWGYVKRLIINSVTRQISYADVIVASSGRLIRIPWEDIEVRNEGIKLRVSEGEVQTGARKPSGHNLAKTVSMDVWP